MYPDADSLPTIPANRNLTEFYSAVDSEMMIRIFSRFVSPAHSLVSECLSPCQSAIHSYSLDRYIHPLPEMVGTLVIAIL